MQNLKQLLHHRSKHKELQWHTHLGSTSDTTIKEIDMYVDNPQGPQLVTNIQKFIFTDKVSVFVTC